MFSAKFLRPVYLAVFTLFFGVIGLFTALAEEGAAPVQLEPIVVTPGRFNNLRWRVGENFAIEAGD